MSIDKQRNSNYFFAFYIANSRNSKTNWLMSFQFSQQSHSVQTHHGVMGLTWFLHRRCNNVQGKHYSQQFYFKKNVTYVDSAIIYSNVALVWTREKTAERSGPTEYWRTTLITGNRGNWKKSEGGRIKWSPVLMHVNGKPI
jgi:hypothetical protein